MDTKELARRIAAKLAVEETCGAIHPCDEVFCEHWHDGAARIIEAELLEDASLLDWLADELENHSDISHAPCPALRPGSDREWFGSAAWVIGAVGFYTPLRDAIKAAMSKQAEIGKE